MEGLIDPVLQFFNSLLVVFFWIILLAVGSLLLKIIISKAIFEKKLKEALSKKEDKVYLFIKIPPNNEQKENAMEEFLHSLHRILPNNVYLSLEMASSDQFLRFYIVVDSQHKNILESQLYAQYPEAEIEEIKDYLPDFEENTAFIQLYFKRSSMFPINTYHNLEEDLLKNLSAILSKTSPDEKVFFQIALKRVGSKFWHRGFGAFHFKLFGKKYESGGDPTASYHKLSQDLYMGKFRIAYVAESKIAAEAKLSSLIGLFKSVKGSNEFKKKRFEFTKNLNKLFKSRMFEVGDLWSGAEIATLYHFPYKGNVVSNIVQTTSKRAPAPDILPREGLVNPKEVSFIGETNYRNEKRKFGIKREDRRRHLYVVGKTGIGKSRLLELLLISDIQNGEGCCLLDPHGDLAD